MSAPTLGQWKEWRRRCAIAKCGPETADALASYALAKFRHYALPLLGDAAPADELPDATVCFHLLEHWMAVARPRSGRRYKQWLFARAEGLPDRDGLATILAGAALLLRTVVRKWLARRPAREEVSLDAPVPGLEGVTLVDLVPDARDMAIEETLMEDLARSLADEVFDTMRQPVRLVMLARVARLPLYHPLLLDAFGCGRTKAAETWKEVLTDVARRIRRKWPDEPAAWQLRLALRASDALDGLLIGYDANGAIRARLTQLARS